MRRTNESPGKLRPRDVRDFRRSDRRLIEWLNRPEKVIKNPNLARREKLRALAEEWEAHAGMARRTAEASSPVPLEELPGRANMNKEAIKLVAMTYAEYCEEFAEQLRVLLDSEGS